MLRASRHACRRRAAARRAVLKIQVPLGATGRVPTESMATAIIMMREGLKKTTPPVQASISLESQILYRRRPRQSAFAYHRNASWATEPISGI